VVHQILPIVETGQIVEGDEVVELFVELALVGIGELKLQHGAAHPDLVAVDQPPLLDPVAVDRRAVGALQVDHRDVGRGGLQQAVLAADRLVVDADAGGGAAAQRHGRRGQLENLARVVAVNHDQGGDLLTRPEFGLQLLGPEDLGGLIQRSCGFLALVHNPQVKAATL